VDRIVVLGPGGAGKSTFARLVEASTGIPHIELDKVLWSAGLEPMPPERWVGVQEQLLQRRRWILDGDLGPYDVLGPRLRRAEAVVLFDVPTWRCAWRALRGSQERLDFWRWLLTWRRRYKPTLLRAVREHQVPNLLVVRRPADRDRVMRRLMATSSGR
jgi:adenylate kinase family enzyme